MTPEAPATTQLGGGSLAGSTHAGSTHSGSTHAGSAGSAGAHGYGHMEGLPDPAFGGAVVLAALASFLLLYRHFEPRQESPGWRWNVLEYSPIRRVVSSRLFQPALQLVPLTLLLVVMAAGLYGTPVADRNVATVLTWGIWWVLLIVDIVLLGRMWCAVCPWEAIAGAIRRLSFWRRTDEPLALNRPWPRWLRTVYPATFLFLGLTWLELGYGVTFSPRGTALLALAMTVLAVLAALFFEKRAFCKYGCLVGRICGLYAMMAPVEVRAADPQVCADCRTKDCIFGNDAGYPCPTSQYPAKMDTNAYCTVCTECVKTCPSNNIAINLRPWGEDLKGFRKPRRDEAVLAVAMMAMTSFHGLTMTPVWNSFLDEVRRGLGLSQLSAFSFGMVLVLALPALAFLALATASARLGAAPPSRASYVRALAYPLVAVALLYHLAHNAGHFFVEGGRIVSVASDPFGWGWDLFGTAAWTLGPLLSMNSIWILQVTLVLVGHWAATAAALRITHRYPGGPDPAGARMLAALLVWSLGAFNLWLLAQPMEMRTGL